MGDALADEVQRVLTEHNISVDVVIPVRREYLSETFVCTQTPHLGAGYISCRRTEPSPKAKTTLPRGIHQEPIRGTNFYHARPTNEVCRV